MKTSKLFFGMLLAALAMGFAACSSDDDEAKMLDITDICGDKGTVGPLTVDYFLSRTASGERTTLFGVGEDIVFNVILTNTSEKETADWGFGEDGFSIYDSDLKYVGKQWDEYETTEIKWIFPGKSYSRNGSWLAKTRKALPEGTYYTVVTVKAEGQVKRFLVKFDVR